MPSLRNLWKPAAAAALGAILAFPALPQEAAQPQAQGPVLKRTVNLVNLFATVRDKTKRIVGDLKQEDFKVYEDNQEEKIAFFSKEVTMPITLGLLIDTSGSEQNRLGAEQEAASRFLERVMKKGDMAMVISFDLDVDLLADFTDDRAQIERAISKARVIITDAQDEGSKLRLEEAIESAQRTDTVVHVLLVHDPGYSWRPDVAKKLSDETGGRTIEVSSEKRLNEAFDQISEELRSQYTVGYYPTNTAKDGRFRKVKVETPGKDYKILTRKGYYAPKS